MVETHTISAPEETWEKVFGYAKQNKLSISDVTRQAWDDFFKEKKNYRIIDIVIVFLLSIICVLLIMGVVLL